MKVRKTFEISPDDRIVISIVENNKFEPADRETIELFLTHLYESVVSPGRKKLQEMYDDIAIDIAQALMSKHVREEEDE